MTSQAAYYDTIRDESALTEASRDRMKLGTLLQSGWKSAVYQWGRQELLAHRVVCSEPTAELLVLKDFQTDSIPHPCIDELIKGPASIDDLPSLGQARLRQQCRWWAVADVWAAMRDFLPGSTRRPEGPSIEQEALFLAGKFMNCVIGYGQFESKREEICLEPRDRRLTYSYWLGGSQEVHAADDGGIETYHPQPRERRQVALLKGRKGYQDSAEGVPDITDGLLGEMVGGALAVQQTCHRTKDGDLRTE